MLLGQRRRWMNGTIGAYLYWLVGKGQLEFAMSGLKNARVLQMMWAMQLHQVCHYTSTYYLFPLYYSYLQRPDDR